MVKGKRSHFSCAARAVSAFTVDRSKCTSLTVDRSKCTSLGAGICGTESARSRGRGAQCQFNLEGGSGQFCGLGAPTYGFELTIPAGKAGETW